MAFLSFAAVLVASKDETNWKAFKTPIAFA
jgi:hypothetical protein